VVPLTPSSVLITALLGIGMACGATEFGGGTAGPDSILTNVLSSLSGRTGFHWIRSPSPRVPEYGFRGVSDVRLHVPRADRPADALPEDLFETYWACRNRLPSFPGAPAVWEVWNEPDFYFVRNNAADMAATLKAAWWGVKAGRPDAQVIMPSLAFRPGRYVLELAVNGLASWTDGWNVHFYGWAADYPAFLAHQRAFATAIGCDKPIWVTEIGHLGMPLTIADDPAALAVQAAFHERTLIESWSRGVDRHLLFLLTAYKEVRSDLGLTTTNGTWRPAMTSAVKVVRALQGTRPVYRLVHRPSGEDMGIVLERDTGTWWTILWSPARPGDVALPGVGPAQPMSETLRVRPVWPQAWNEIRVGIEGETALAPSQLQEFNLSSDGNLHLHGPAVRFGISDCRWVPWTDGDELRPQIHRSTREALNAVPPVRKPSPVVVRFRPDASMVADKPAQVLKVSAEGGGSGQLDFYNFSDQPQRGAWVMTPPPGWSMGGEVPEHALEVPAMSRREVAVQFRPAKDAGESGDPLEPGRFTARWEGADGSVDESSVRVVVDRPPGRVWHKWDWRQIVSSPGRADAWQLFVQEDQTITVDVRSPWGLNREVALHVALPQGAELDDLFAMSLRKVRGRGTPFVQVHLTTAEGETWRHGELMELESKPSTVEARLGDFSPAIWGRHRTLLFPPVEKARWLSLLIQGVQAGDVLELRDPRLSR